MLFPACINFSLEPTDSIDDYAEFPEPKLPKVVETLSLHPFSSISLLPSSLNVLSFTYFYARAPFRIRCF